MAPPSAVSKGRTIENPFLTARYGMEAVVMVRTVAFRGHYTGHQEAKSGG